MIRKIGGLAQIPRPTGTIPVIAISATAVATVAAEAASGDLLCAPHSLLSSLQLYSPSTAEAALRVVFVFRPISLPQLLQLLSDSQLSHSSFESAPFCCRDRFSLTITERGRPSPTSRTFLVRRRQFFMFDCPIVSVSVSEIDLRRRPRRRQHRSSVRAFSLTM